MRVARERALQKEEKRKGCVGGALRDLRARTHRNTKEHGRSCVYRDGPPVIHQSIVINQSSSKSSSKSPSISHHLFYSPGMGKLPAKASTSSRSCLMSARAAPGPDR